MSQCSDRHARFARDHEWAPGHMSGYLDGDLSVRARDRLARHLQECDECRRLLAGLRAVVDRLHRLPAPGGGVAAVEIAASVRARLTEPTGH